MVKYGGRIAIPLGMWKKVENIINEKGDLGYRSVSEFVIDTIRRRLEEIEKEQVFK